jgi:hypothetical protein
MCACFSWKNGRQPGNMLRSGPRIVFAFLVGFFKSLGEPVLRSAGETMFYRAAAEGVLLFHLAFIAFALLGAALAIRWRWIILLHIPAAAWCFFIEVSGRICPFTYAENFLRIRGGQSGYSEGFVEHYLLAIIYPAGLTREVQFILAGIVIAVNAAIYAWLLLVRRLGAG